MQNNTLTHAILYILLGVVLITIVMAVLTGKNGIINQEREKYNETHQEEVTEQDDEVLMHGN